ncbi:MAG TPA: sugar phosphate nucleotidyltransferase [Steroidobacteraceae bacterium]|nr:sugar phosphate nucleotidyltransferase [Steroidobacteraceae bacterium]
MDLEKHWAVILAAGDGRRLRGLTTTPAGISVPKQFCALDRGPSLLEEAVERARRVAAPERACAVVAERHECWWALQLQGLAAQNILVQPENRGTANGILLALLWILRGDPLARVVLLPADHHVHDEETLARALREAASRARPGWAEIVLLGIEPREVDSELGYIVPGNGSPGHHRSVERFVEKPAPALARALIERGALWNAFIMAADAQALLRLYERRYPDVVSAMRSLIAHTGQGAPSAHALAHLYAGLPELDFSRSILQGEEPHLRVLAVPECGWSDLGTPQRVAQALRDPQHLRPAGPAAASHAFLSLAAQHRAAESRAAEGHPAGR